MSSIAVTAQRGYALFETNDSYSLESKRRSRFRWLTTRLTGIEGRVSSSGRRNRTGIPGRNRDGKEKTRAADPATRATEKRLTGCRSGIEVFETRPLERHETTHGDHRGRHEDREDECEDLVPVHTRGNSPGEYECHDRGFPWTIRKRVESAVTTVGSDQSNRASTTTWVTPALWLFTRRRSSTSRDRPASSAARSRRSSGRSQRRPFGVASW